MTASISAVTTGTAEDTAEDSRHEGLIKLLDYETIHALKVMLGRDGLRLASDVDAVAGSTGSARRSIPQAAEILKISARTLTRTMLKLDEAYKNATGMNLLENAGGRVGYRLTDDGAEFAVDAGEVMDALTSLVHDVTGPRGRLSAPTTKACLPMLKDLNDQLLAGGASIWLDPELHRTADIHRPRERETAGPYAFYSIGLQQEESTPYADHQHLKLKSGTELVVYKAERFRLLAPESLAEELEEPQGWRGPISMTRVLRGGWTLLVPNGGAVYDFLDQNTNSWSRLGRPPKDILDLQAGLLCLDLAIYRRRMNHTGGSVMIVHQEEEDLRQEGLLPEGYRIYSIEEDQPCWALTGLFRDPHQLSRISRTQRARWNTVWKIARRQCTSQAEIARIGA